jgi:hypothetical protein
MANTKGTGGLPPLKRGERSVVVGAAVTREEREIIRAIAEDEGMTVSQLLRLYVMDLCARRNDDASSFERQGAAA